MTIPKTVNFLRSILGQVSAEECELVLSKSNAALTRFSANHIHQSTQARIRQLNLRLFKDGKVGAFSTDRFDQDSIAYAIQKAEEIGAVVPEGLEQKPLLPAEEPLAESGGYHDSTALTTAFDRAQVIRRIVDLAQPRGAQLSGAIRSDTDVLCVVNSRGTQSYEESSVAELSLVASKNGRSGYSYWIGNDFAALPYETLVNEAVDLVDSPLEERTIKPGRYTVIFDTYAVGTLISFLAILGFGAKTYLEGRSFTSTRMGKKVFSGRITLWDDGRDPTGLPRAFDFEGAPKRKVMLIDRGKITAVVTDSRTAPLVETTNSGHALPAPNSEGPMPTNLFLAPGKSTLKRMIESTPKGIYVRALHYVNVVEPMTVQLTGMTRHGTFLIENGRITHPVRNLRFSESLLQALTNVLQVSSETHLVEGIYGAVRVPALKVKDFLFTGVSDQ